MVQPRYARFRFPAVDFPGLSQRRSPPLLPFGAPSITAMRDAVKTLASHLIDGGVLVFRDYGRYDDGELGIFERVKDGEQSGVGVFVDGDDADDDDDDDDGTVEDKSSHFYIKSDQTLIYYFTVEDLTRIFCLPESEGGAGLVMESGDYIMRQYNNRGDGVRRRRVWIEGRFRKGKKETVLEEAELEVVEEV